MKMQKSQIETNVNGAAGPSLSNMMPPAREKAAIPAFANTLYTPSIVPLISFGRVRIKKEFTTMNCIVDAKITATDRTVE